MINPLESLQTSIALELKEVEKLMLNSAAGKINLIPLIASHLINSGGKRIRPSLTLIFCKMFGYEGEEAIYAAAAIEFIHSATLLHDDVVDESNLRRQVATAKYIWGNKSSILVGDFLLSVAFQWIVKCKNINLLKVLSDASVAIAEGEIKQLVGSNDLSISEERYLDTIDYKSATLFSAACESGAILAKQNIDDSCKFGRNLGIAFQIIDDIIDYKNQSSETGKMQGNDFAMGKVTLPVITCYKNHSGPEEKRFWERCINKLDQKPSDFNKALEYIEKHKALETSMNKAEHYTTLAKENLKAFPDKDNSIKKQLSELLEFITNRAF